jgi:hypothetical protein
MPPWIWQKLHFRASTKSLTVSLWFHQTHHDTKHTHLVKEPLRKTLLPPYGHTNRVGINTVPTTLPTSLTGSMIWLKIQPPIQSSTLTPIPSNDHTSSQYFSLFTLQVITTRKRKNSPSQIKKAQILMLSSNEKS